MDFKYRVKGKVVQGFILRGDYKQYGAEVDICLYENELDFVKERCNLVTVEPFKEQDNVVEFPRPVLKEEKVQEVVPEQNKPIKEEKQDDRPSNRGNKRKSKAQV